MSFWEQSSDEIMAGIRHELEKSSSPWCNRAGAAAYLSCSMTTIDQAANEGKVKRYFREGTPMFKKADLDKWVETSPMPQKRIIHAKI